MLIWFRKKKVIVLYVISYSINLYFESQML